MAKWINEEIKQRGWSQRELARRSGVSNTLISKVMSDDVPASWEFCLAIAKPLGKSPLEVFQIAGLLDGPNGEQAEQLSDAEMLQQIWTALKQARIISSMSCEDIETAKAKLDAMGEHPDIEPLLEIWPHLDAMERRNVYDYIRWRLQQQLERLNSSEKRDSEADQYTIGVADMITAIDRATPKERAAVIAYLQKLDDKRPGES